MHREFIVDKSDPQEDITLHKGTKIFQIKGKEQNKIYVLCCILIMMSYSCNL